MTNNQNQFSQTLIVGVGASAGGLEAFQEFVAALSDASGVAIVFVQHLDPNNRSLLPDLLRKQTPLPIIEIETRKKLKPGCIYICPARGLLEIRGEQVVVVNDESSVREKNSIDHFFHSLAESRGERAVGVILSGAGSDGTLGLKSISDAGGMTFAQDGASAKFDAMPRNAATTGVADHVMPPAEIAAELLDYAAYLKNLGPVADSDQHSDNITKVIPDIAEILLSDTGHNFKHYKTSTLARRIQRRMQVLKIAAVADYVERLSSDNDECQNLFRELLIGVTAFFRDPESFERLADEVIPKLFENRTNDEAVRIWVPGCATGEEAYTIAILCREYMDKFDNPKSMTVQVFASDIDERALSIARQGIYPSGIADQISPERLKRFFIKKGKRYHIRSEIRETVLFSPHNLISDPPFSRQDFISCRNLLIYLGPHLQKKLIPLFHFALRPNGFLFLGPSESISTHTDLFRPVDPKHRISQRKGTAIGRSAPLALRTHSAGIPQPPEVSPVDDDKSDVVQVMQRIILDEFSPKSVVIDEDGQVLCSSAETNKYLSIGDGTFQNNILKMARRGLRIGLRATLSEAKAKRRRVVHENLSVQTDDGKQRVMVTIQPMMRMGEDSGLFIVVFHDVGLPMGLSVNTTDEVASGLADASIDRQSNEMIEQLERELATTRDDLEKTMQEMETANEELKSSNEELLSMNEELQSANEELETSKEEIRAGSEAVVRANNDLENLLRSTQIATIFLDDDLSIRSFTPAATEIYSLIPTDIGRPLEKFVPAVRDMPELPDPASLSVDQPIEHNVTAENGKTYIRRVLPYQSEAGETDGMVVTFTDISKQMQVQRELEARERQIKTMNDRLELSLEVSDNAPWNWDMRTNDVVSNPILNRLYGFDEDASPKLVEFLDRMDEPTRQRVREAIEVSIQTGEPFDQEYSIRWPSGELRHVRARGRVRMSEDGQVQDFFGVVTDITQRKQRELNLADSEAHLRRVIDNQLGLVGVLDCDGVLLEANHVAVAVGGTTREEVIGRPFWECPWWTFSDESIERLKDAFARSVQGEVVRYDVEIRIADDQRIMIDFMLAPVFDAEGEVTHVIPSGVDIRERHQFQAQLLESESRFRAMTDSLPLLVWLHDTDGKLVSVNRAYVEYFGVGEEDIRDVKWQTLAHLDDFESYTGEFASCVSERCDFHAQVRVKRADGQWRWLESWGQPRFSGSGEYQGHIGASADMTDRVEAVRDLAESRRRLALAMNAARMGSFVWDRISDEVKWDSEWLQVAGLPDDVERSGKTFFDMVHPEDIANLKHATEESLCGGTDYKCEFRIIRRDGQLRWFAAVGNWVKDEKAEDGLPRRLAGLNWDITEQKEAENEIKLNEERLRVAAGAAGFGMFLIDVDNNHVNWSDEFRRLVGVGADEKFDLAIGDLPEFIHPDDVKKVKDRIDHILSDLTEPDHWFSHRIVKKTGEIRYVRMQTRSLYEGKGAKKRIRMIVGTLTDVTQQHDYEEKLKRQKKVAESANKSKSEFVANLSHEIRTPMTAILGYAEMLRDHTESEEARRYLSTIRRNGDYLLEIINDILDLSKIEAGKLEVNVERFEPAQVIEDVRSIMEVRAKETGLTLDVEYESKVPKFIESDAKRLKQILINLVGNAVKFTKKGGVKIVIRFDPVSRRSTPATRRQDAGGTLRFSVTDTGIGMTSQQQDRLFKPFSQGDSLITQQFGGTGLGLAISQRLASMLGGDIGVESKIDEGSTFTVSIATGDLKDTPLIYPAGRAAPTSDAQDAKHIRLAANCLVVDDRRDIRFLSKRIITKAGGTVTEAEDGVQAVATVKQANADGITFDLILLDMQMPNMDGYETARELRKLGYEGPIIALTADAMQGDMSKCLEAGCNDYLSKPIDQAAMLQKITKLTSSLSMQPPHNT